MVLPEFESSILQRIDMFADSCQPTITKFTTCIYCWQEKIRKWGVAGTGVLLRIAERHFLMSAAHVLDLGSSFQMPFAVQPSIGPANLVPLRFLSGFSSLPPSDVSPTDPDFRDGDPLDVGIAELHPESVRDLSTRHRFLSLIDIDPRPVSHVDGVF